MDLRAALLSPAAHDRCAAQRCQVRYRLWDSVSADSIAAIACAGESAANTEPIAATPAGRELGSPAFISARARSGAMPPSANTGIAPARTAAPRPSGPHAGPSADLEIGSNMGPNSCEVGACARGARHSRAGSDSTLQSAASARGRRRAMLTPIELNGRCTPSASDRDRHIDAIVDDKRRAVSRAHFAQPRRQFVELARGQILLAQLQRDDTRPSDFARGLKRRLARREQAAALYNSPIRDQVKFEIDARAGSRCLRGQDGALPDHPRHRARRRRVEPPLDPSRQEREPPRFDS